MTRLCQPWVMHWFPGRGPENMENVSLSLYVAMWDFAQRSAMGGR